MYARLIYIYINIYTQACLQGVPIARIDRSLRGLNVTSEEYFVFRFDELIRILLRDRASCLSMQARGEGRSYRGIRGYEYIFVAKWASLANDFLTGIFLFFD